MAHEGLARYLQVVVERSSQRAQVVLVGNCAQPDALAPALDLIRERLGDALHSLWFNANTHRANTILGPQFVNWHGPDCVVEQFGDADIHYPPGAFGQSNLEIAARIIDHLRRELPPSPRVAEFYAGVGAIGLSLLGSVQQLTLNEVAPASLEGLARGVEALDTAARRKLDIVPGPAGAAADAARDADVVIVDPPRKGLDAPLRSALQERPPRLLLYVSCSLESLRSDLAALLQGGTLRLAGLTAFNLMPFTDHVETVARLERA
jgi:23S rRNA (uracil1939-C5)-methyltransferase